MDKFADNKYRVVFDELRGCYDYFDNEYNKDDFYGLIKDRTNNEYCSSISATGFGLCSLITGVDYNWISYNQAKLRAEKTIDTFLNLETVHGFFYHFIDMRTGKKYHRSEVSLIDTALLVCGMLAVGEYFGGAVKEKAKKIFDNIEWNWFYDPKANQFYMGYYDENGFSGHWDTYGEQLILYVLSVASETYPVDKKVYDGFKRKFSSYGGINDICYAHFGALFTYQFSHAFLDFRDKKDGYNINWFDNSVKATKASRQYSILNKDKSKSYSEVSWGLTACDFAGGYKSFGSMPADDVDNDGTIAPCGAIGSIVFLPDEVIDAMNNYYKYPLLWGKYGFYDSYNLDINFFANTYVGIDKGISLIMINNFLSGAIWNSMNKCDYIKKGFKILNIK